MRSNFNNFTKAGGVLITVTAVVATAVMLTLAVIDTEITARADSGTKPADIYVEAYNQHNLIRFHVIANSDSDRDQELKRKVRDLIVMEMTPEFSKAKNLDEAREIAQANLGKIASIARKEVKAWGEEYPVSVQMGNFEFPVKTYGDITLGAGNYEAVKVVIGHGQGANWWCVLFPPLCFVDVSRSLGAPEPETGFSDPQLVTASAVYNHQNIKVRYKIVELFDRIFK
ncbi:stage II sporulation protein R [Phosphitispora sp. TUW77]|uniref:stage II sporulation protein R n=1 Tax=Phosphitispora sp. TUW77 TaxID=3152361 RepID=UPI003AB3FC2E